MLSFETLYLLAPAFIAGAMISLVHISFGIEVLKRGIIFLDLAVAQFAALGMVAFHVFIEGHAHGEGLSENYMAIGSLCAGLSMAIVCAIGLNTLEKYSGRYHEALIGSAFVIAASMSILIISNDPHGGEQMKNILAGQILWITWKDLVLYSPIFILMASIWLFAKTKRQQIFYILFAMTIPFSVKLIGVYLVFASLILPALATVKILKSRWIKSYVISALSFAVGLIASYIIDIPSGPAIVMSMLAVSLLFWFVFVRKRVA